MTCTNEGKDRRYVRWLLCPLQNLLSFKSEREPRWLVKKLRHDSIPDWPEPGVEAGSYVSLGIAWPPYAVYQRWRGAGRSILIRLGWRYDMNWRGYIFPAAKVSLRMRLPMGRGY